MRRAELIAVAKSCVRRLDGTEFLLSSGRRSSWQFDLLRAPAQLGAMCIPADSRWYIGIATGGAVLVAASVPSPWRGFAWKDHTSSGWSISLPSHYEQWSQFDRGVCLVDDVVTTERTLKEVEAALAILGVPVRERWVVLDRRRPEDVTLRIESLASAADLGLAP